MRPDASDTARLEGGAHGALTTTGRGRLARVDGRLAFEASGTGQSFEVERIEPEGTALPEGQELELEGALVDVHSGQRIIVRRKDAASGGSR